MFALAILVFCFSLNAAYADDQPPAPQKIAFSGEMDLGVTYESVSGLATDRPTELKFGSTLTDGNVGFNARFLFYPFTVLTSVTTFPSPISVDYAYGTYLLYWTLFDHFMTAKISVGDFANFTDYVLNYNSNGFTLLLQGNPIGGYIEGLVGGELAFSPIKNLTLAAFIPWDRTGGGTPFNDTIGNFDVNVSYNYPKLIKIDAGYGNSYNGDISGALVQPNSGINLAYLNISLLSVENLTIGAEYGNYTNVVSASPVENYITGTIAYSFPDEESGNSLNFSDDIFLFIPTSGTDVIQEYFSTNYTFSQVFSGADVILDMDVNYANNYPTGSATLAPDSTNANSLVASHRNLTFNPWVKLSFGVKAHILALGYAYNYDLDASKTGYSKVILNATIYY
jgi:hypothetical protein